MEEEILDKKEIHLYLTKLGKELRKIKVKGEIVVCGGAAMLLKYNSRQSTKDIDGVYYPSTEINELAEKIAIQEKLPDGWINDSVKYSKSYIKTLRENSVYYKTFYNLSVYTADIEQLIVMKLVSFRIGQSHDLEDLNKLLDVYKENHTINPGIIKSLITKHYGDLSKLSEEALEYLEDLG